MHRLVASAQNPTSFAGVCNDGTVVTWGKAEWGGDSTGVQQQLQDIRHIYNTGRAFAAVKGNGSVVTWGDPTYLGVTAHKCRSSSKTSSTSTAMGGLLQP